MWQLYVYAANGSALNVNKILWNNSELHKLKGWIIRRFWETAHLPLP